MSYIFFSGIILSNLSEVSLNSTRNLAIIGIALLFGVMVPRYIEMYPDDIRTGNNLMSTSFEPCREKPVLCPL